MSEKDYCDESCRVVVRDGDYFCKRHGRKPVNRIIGEGSRIPFNLKDHHPGRNIMQHVCYELFVCDTHKDELVADSSQ